MLLCYSISSTRVQVVPCILDCVMHKMSSRILGTPEHLDQGYTNNVSLNGTYTTPTHARSTLEPRSRDRKQKRIDRGKAYMSRMDLVQMLQMNLSTCRCWPCSYHHSPLLLGPAHCCRINCRICSSDRSLRFRSVCTRSTSFQGSVVTHACAPNVSYSPKHNRSINVPFVVLPSSSGASHQSSMPPSASNRSNSVTTAIMGTTGFRVATLLRMRRTIFGMIVAFCFRRQYINRSIPAFWSSWRIASRIFVSEDCPRNPGTSYRQNCLSDPGSVTDG